MDQDQLNYNQFSSKKNANKLTLMVRNGVTKSVEHWAKNHEKRIQLRSKMKKLVSKYPILSGSTLDFSSFLAENNGNRLTANMRNNLLNKIAQISTNHEMRLRELEKQLPQQVFHCVGQYQYLARETRNCIQDTTKTDPYVAVWHNVNGVRERYYDQNPYNRNTSSKTVRRGLNTGNGDIIGCSFANYPNGRYSCSICSGVSANSCNLRWCKIETSGVYEKKSCSSFNENACKAQNGCSRELKS